MNMTNVLLPVFYLPPISWFSVLLNPENEIVFEQFENFRNKPIETEPISMGQTENYL
jgi:hypothetical protein